METKSRKIKSVIGAELPKSYMVYADTIYWIAIMTAVAALFIPVIVLAGPDKNVLNPRLVFGAIFNGAPPSEIWALSPDGGFPGAHFYLRFPAKADSWAMFTVNVGCAVGFFGLVPAVFYQAVKEKDWFCAIFGAVLATLILLSLTGVLLLNTV